MLSFCAVATWFLAAGTADADSRSVLILLPGQPGLPAASVLATGIRAPLIAEWSTDITIETEHVDVARFKGPEHEGQLRALYQSKYAAGGSM